MKSGAGRSFSWMSFNRAASITQGATSLNLSYGPEHQRYKMCAGACNAVSPTTTYLYDPATGGMSEKYVPGVQPNIWRDYIVADGRSPGLGCRLAGGRRCALTTGAASAGAM